VLVPREGRSRRGEHRAGDRLDDTGERFVGNQVSHFKRMRRKLAKSGDRKGEILQVSTTDLR
jgi:hypothetical protein